MEFNSLEMKSFALKLLNRGNNGDRPGEADAGGNGQESLILKEMMLSTELMREHLQSVLLHDILQHVLGFKIGLENLSSMTSPALERQRHVKRLVRSAEETSRTIYNLVVDLRPPSLDELGLAPTLIWFGRKVEKLNPGVTVRFKIDLADQAMPIDMALTVYRVIERAVAQTIEYRRADLIDVEINSQTKELSLDLIDNGLPYDLFDLPHDVLRKGGVDLACLVELVDLSGGKMIFRDHKNGGAEMRVNWKM